MDYKLEEMKLKDLLRIVSTKFDSVDFIKHTYNRLIELRRDLGDQARELEDFLRKIGEWEE